MLNKLIVLSCLILISLGCSLLEGNSDAPGAQNDDAAPTPFQETDEKDEKPVAQPVTAGGAEKDLLSLGAGANLVSASSEYTPGQLSRWSGYGAIDESPKVGWAAKENAVTDQSLVFVLPAETTFKSIGFDTGSVDTKGSGAKDVVVSVSTTSAESGFSEILSVSLESAVDNQNFDVKDSKPAKWVKVEAKNNHGAESWLEIMEVRGYGEQKQIDALARDVSGTYSTEQFGDFHIKQEGTTIIGCYEFDGGLLEGGIEGSVMYLNWKENGDTDSDRGPAVFLFDSEGKKFEGFWRYEANDYYNGKWDGQKKSEEVGSCEHFKGLSEDNAAQNQLEKKLSEEGRAVVYGINFDFNSDKIRDESKTVLNQVVEVLKKNSEWKMTIEGHTDNIGGEKFNQLLSEKRAGSVRKYLIDAGIDESRLTAKGVGMTKPVAKNTSEEGRARNRRVELVKQ